jgi:hypothetical protein
MANTHFAKQSSFVCAILCATLAGCNRQSVPNEVAALNTSNIRRLANLFAACQSVNNGQGPKDVAAIKNLANQLPSKNLEWMGIDKSKLDALFVSERDGKPFKIKFGAFRSIQGPHIPIVFEAVGRNGMRQVAWTNANVEEVDNGKYDQLWGEKAAPAAGPPPSTAADAAAAKK